MSTRFEETGKEPVGLRRPVPDNVRAAVERMCMPLDPSWLKGATAAADAHCMKLIREYILGSDDVQPGLDVPEQVVPGVSGERCDEIIDKHLSGVLPSGNELRPLLREAILAILSDCLSAQFAGPGQGNWISVQDRMPEEGVEVHTWTQSPARSGDCYDTDWLEEGCFAENKGPVDYWHPKYPKVVRYPVTQKD